MSESVKTGVTEGSPGTGRVSRKLDELATALMIGGIEKIVPGDFLELGELARSEGRKSVADRAGEMADEFATAGNSTPQLADRLSGWMDELRVAMENPEADSLNESLGQTPHQETLGPTASLSAFSADVEMVREFVLEAREHLLAVEEKMLLLERDASDIEAINAVFRGFHTIKGLAGFLELGPIQEVAHEVETLLDLVRTAKISLDPDVVDGVFAGLDYIRTQIDGIQRSLDGGSAQKSPSNKELLQTIRNMCGRGRAGAGSSPNEDHPANEQDPAGEIFEAEVQSAPVPELRAEPGAEIQRIAVESPVANPTGKEARVVPPANGSGKPGAMKSGTPRPSSVKEERRSADASSVRIETAKLDYLMNMVGEMVIAQTLISHNPEFPRIKDARLSSDLGLLARITADVQKITTSMRMVPIGALFQKTARLVRDLSRQVGKQVVLEMIGEDTELDKNIAEELSDPLMHMVRNSIDHGIETPEERSLTSKDATARIGLSAYHSSGQIVIEISDDGRGLDRDRILAKAIERGIVKPGTQLADSEVFLLIFEAGFSTAEKVTGLSGRGVGMDVVRKHVQKLRGRIEIRSEPGIGTTFFIRLPLTLAIIEGLIVSVGDSRYIVPIFSVTEMFRPEPSMISTVRGRAEMAMVRGNLLPVVRLHERFRLTPRSHCLTDGILIVAESQGKQFCLFVDSLMGKQEVVIKGLGETFKGVSGLAGCAILGDGRVGLILDIEGIFRGRF